MDVINQSTLWATAALLLKAARKFICRRLCSRAEGPACLIKHSGSIGRAVVASGSVCIVLTVSSAVVRGQVGGSLPLNVHSQHSSESQHIPVGQSSDEQSTKAPRGFRSFGDQTITSSEFNRTASDEYQTSGGVRQAVFQSGSHLPSDLAADRQDQPQYQPKPASGLSLNQTAAGHQLRPVPPNQNQARQTIPDKLTELPPGSHSARVQQVSLTNGAIQSIYDASGLPADKATQITNAEAPFLDLTAVNEHDGPLSSTPGSGTPPVAFSSEQFVTMLIWILVLICLMVLTILGLRKWQRTRGLLPVVNGQSRVLQTLSLGPGRTISLIEMNGLRALVGADAGGIRTIVLAPPSFDETLSTVADSDVSQTLLEA